MFPEKFSPHLQQKLQALPTSPGVYLMKNTEGEIFYVGKAKNLRDRVRSYFSGGDTRSFVQFLDQWLADIEVVLTRTEKEAILFENELIKAHRPRFNIKLIDDKRFLCLRLDVRQPYPRLEVVRRFSKDGALYFGPYHSARSLRQTLRLVNRYFQLRTCSDQVMRTRQRPCLQYEIKRCPAPCVFNLEDNGVYKQNIANVRRFLLGETKPLLAQLGQSMLQHANAEQFEAAALVRDQIAAIEKSMEQQILVSSEFKHQDIVGFYREGPLSEIHVLEVRGGRLSNARRFSIQASELPDHDILADFASQYYCNHLDPPEEILFPPSMQWAEPLAALLSEQQNRSIAISLPQVGNKQQMVALAMRNAKQAFVDKQREQGNAKTTLEALAKALSLPRPPQRMECCDISHLQGSHIVGSVVCFKDGLADKSQYRRFKIRSTTDQDDYQSIYEVVARRIKRGLQEGNLPDLLIIDGGKGQLSAALTAVRELGATTQVIGLAKARPPTSGSSTGSGRQERSLERVFLPHVAKPLILPQNSAELYLLCRIRDEAHRFAIGFQRQKRRTHALQSELDGIEGLGPKKKQKLLKRFGSVAQIKLTSVENLAQEIGKKLAHKVLEKLHCAPS